MQAKLYDHLTSHLYPAREYRIQDDPAKMCSAARTSENLKVKANSFINLVLRVAAMGPQVFIGSVLAGVIAGLVTIYAVPARYELLVWVVLVITGGAIAKRDAGNRLFRNGFLTAVLMGIAVTLTHIFLIDDYVASHKREIEQIEKIMIARSYRITLLLLAPMYWAALGVVTGLWTLGLGRMGKSR